MEGDKSESQEDNQISPKKSANLAETVEGLQQCVKEILEQIEQDVNFSEMTDEIYDQKKFYLTTHLNELSDMHNVLFDLVLLKNSSDLEENLKLKPNESEKQSNAESAADDIIRTQKENLEIENAKVIQLQKQVSDLLHLASDSSYKIQTFEKKFSLANNILSNLNIENTMLKDRIKCLQTVENQIDIHSEEIHGLQEKLASEMSLLERTHAAKEISLNAEITRLKLELKEKCELGYELNKNLEDLTLEKDGVNTQLEKLQADHVRVNSSFEKLQAEHVRVNSSLENEQKVTNELTLKVAELEKEVVRQKEIVSDITKDKIEAIKQLSFSLDHYMSKYKKLRHEYITNNTRCFGFLR